MASIVDVAKKAGVGIATVSRVINNSGYVKKETRDKIEKVINEIGYVPNEIARSMTLQKNNIVAFILPNTTHLFFAELLNEVEEKLFEVGYKMMLCNSSRSLKKEIAYIDMLKTNRVDAIILLTNNDVEPFLDKSLPIVSFDRKFKNVPYVASDNYHGGILAANHLIEKHCEHILFIGDDAQGEHTSVETEVSKRRIGFLKTLKDIGIKDITSIEYPLGDYVEIPEDVMDKIDMHENVDGIFCISDVVASKVIKHLESKGKRVPEDVKVIGFDGGRSFLNLGAKITSIGQSPELIAEAITKVLKNYNDKKPVESLIVPIYFEQGETT